MCFCIYYYCSLSLSSFPLSLSSPSYPLILSHSHTLTLSYFPSHPLTLSLSPSPSHLLTLTPSLPLTELPNKPEGFTITLRGDQSVGLVWQAPASSPLQPVTEYVLQLGYVERRGVVNSSRVGVQPLLWLSQI